MPASGRLGERAKVWFDLARSGRWRELTRRLSWRVFSTTRYQLLCRDLASYQRWEDSIPPVDVRVATPEDVQDLFRLAPALSDEAVSQRLSRRSLYNARVGTCYVGLVDGKPRYAQWLIPASQSEDLRVWSRNFFPALESHEGIVEGVFTHEMFRRRGIMRSAHEAISEIAREQGIRDLLAFVSADNEQSLQAFRNCGYEHLGEVTETWRFGVRRIATERYSGSNPGLGELVSPARSG